MSARAHTVRGPRFAHRFALALQLTPGGAPGRWTLFPLPESCLVPLAHQTLFRAIASDPAERTSHAFAGRVTVAAAPTEEGAERGSGWLPCPGVLVELFDTKGTCVRRETYDTAAVASDLARSRAHLLRAALASGPDGPGGVPPDQPEATSCSVAYALMAEPIRDAPADDAAPGGGSGFTMLVRDEARLLCPAITPWRVLERRIARIQESSDRPSGRRDAPRVLVARPALTRFRDTWKPQVERGGFFVGRLTVDPEVSSEPVPLLVLEEFRASTALDASNSHFTWCGRELERLRRSHPPEQKWALAPAHTHVSIPSVTGEPVESTVRPSLLFFSTQDVATHRFFAGFHEVACVGDASSEDRAVRFFGWRGGSIVPLAHSVFEPCI